MTPERKTRLIATAIHQHRIVVLQGDEWRDLVNDLFDLVRDLSIEKESLALKIAMMTPLPSENPGGMGGGRRRDPLEPILIDPSTLSKENSIRRASEAPPGVADYPMKIVGEFPKEEAERPLPPMTLAIANDAIRDARELARKALDFNHDGPLRDAANGWLIRHGDLVK